MSKGRILLLKGKSRYNVLGRAADEIAEGFKSRGYEVTQMGLRRSFELGRFIEESPQPYAFVFSCQALRFERKEITTIPYIGWIFDDIVHHYDRVEGTKYKNRYLFSIDEEMPVIARTMFPEVKNVFSLLHGGFESKKETKKDIEILFPGSVTAPPKLEDIISNPSPADKLFAEGAIKVLDTFPELSVRKALEIVLNNYEVKLTSNSLIALTKVIEYVDAYARYQYKYKVLKVLLENGIPVHIVGDGYNQMTEAYKEYAIMCGGQDIDEVTDLMQRTKIVINPFPPVYLKGMHERIFSAMLNNAACFTPYSAYLKENLGSRIEYIDMNYLQGMVYRIHEILENYEMYSSQVLEDNYRYALEGHTWKKRGEQIIDFYEQVGGSHE